MLRAGVHGASLRRRTAHDIISHESDKCRTLEASQLAITHPIDLSRRAVEGATHTSTATSAASSPSKPSSYPSNTERLPRYCGEKRSASCPRCRGLSQKWLLPPVHIDKTDQGGAVQPWFRCSELLTWARTLLNVQL